jgi:hypothetical protein
VQRAFKRQRQSDVSLPARLLAGLPAYSPACLPACLPACPHPPTKPVPCTAAARSRIAQPALTETALPPAARYLPPAWCAVSLHPALINCVSSCADRGLKATGVGVAGKYMCSVSVDGAIYIGKSPSGRCRQAVPAYEHK